MFVARVVAYVAVTQRPVCSANTSPVFTEAVMKARFKPIVDASVD